VVGTRLQSVVQNGTPSILMLASLFPSPRLLCCASDPRQRQPRVAATPAPVIAEKLAQHRAQAPDPLLLLE
jgi:hypothetical protein